MSEDPVKYEPLHPDYNALCADYRDLKAHYDKICGEIASSKRGDRAEPDFSRFDRTLSPEPTTTQIRIEALRAAVELAKAVNREQTECVERTINTAKQFAAYLESGE